MYVKYKTSQDVVDLNLLWRQGNLQSKLPPHKALKKFLV